MNKGDTLSKKQRKETRHLCSLQAESFLSTFQSKGQAGHNLIKKTDMLSSFNGGRKGVTFLPLNINNLV